MVLASPRAYNFNCAPQSSQYLYIIIMEILRLRCSDNVFFVTIGDADIESLGLSLHSLITFVFCTTRWCVNLTKIVKSKLYKILSSFDNKKMVNRF